MLKKQTSLALIFAITIISFGCGSPLDLPHKTDDELIKNFQEHKAEFENLLLMVLEDKDLFRVDNDWTSPEEPEKIGVSKERINKYRKIFKQLNIPRGFYAYRKEGIYSFTSSAQGLGVSGSSKGYVWSKTIPKNVIENDIDKYTEKPFTQDKYPVYRHIEGNWYLTYYTN
jgi:hypothetical protein